MSTRVQVDDSYDGGILMKNVSKVLFSMTLVLGLTAAPQAQSGLIKDGASKVLKQTVSAKNYLAEKITAFTFSSLFAGTKDTTVEGANFFGKVVEFFRKKSSLLLIALALVVAQRTGQLSAENADTLKYIIATVK